MRKALGLALAASLLGASSVFAAPIMTFNFTYVGSISQTDYDAAVAAGGFGDPISFSANVNPLSAANANYIHEYKVGFTMSGEAANEHWTYSTFNIPTVAGLSFVGVLDDGTKWTRSTTSGQVWSNNTDGGSNPNDLQSMFVNVTQANANRNLGVSTQWGGPNVTMGYIAVKWDGVTGATLSVTPTAGAWLQTYVNQTSGTTGTIQPYSSTSNIAVNGVVFPAAATATWKGALTNDTATRDTVSSTYQGGINTIQGPYATAFVSDVVTFTSGAEKGYVEIHGGLPNATPEVTTTLIAVQFNLGSGSLADLMSNLNTNKAAFMADGVTALSFLKSGDAAFDHLFASGYYTNTPNNFDLTKTVVFQYTGALAGAFAQGGGGNMEYFAWDLTGTGYKVDKVLAVPEPASLGLLALGALGLIGRRRKA